MAFRGRGFRGRPGGYCSSRRQLFKNYDAPPEQVMPFGYLSHTCDEDLVLKSEVKDVPYFSAPVFTETKTLIGKVDEIFGAVSDYYVSVKLSEHVKSTSFRTHQKFFVDPQKMLSLQRIFPPTSTRLRGSIRKCARAPQNKWCNEQASRGRQNNGYKNTRFTRGNGRGRFNPPQRSWKQRGQKR